VRDLSITDELGESTEGRFSGPIHPVFQALQQVENYTRQGDVKSGDLSRRQIGFKGK